MDVPVSRRGVGGVWVAFPAIDDDGEHRDAARPNCERLSRGRSRTRSMTTPLRRQSVTRTSSTIPASDDQVPATRAQKTRLVRGQVSRTLRIRPPSMGSQTRYGNRESGSGLRATMKFTVKAYGSCVSDRYRAQSLGRDLASSSSSRRQPFVVVATVRPDQAGGSGQLPSASGTEWSRATRQPPSTRRTTIDVGAWIDVR